MHGHNNCKYVKDHGLTIDTDRAVYSEQNGNLKIVVSVTISGADLTRPNEFQLPFHGIDLNRRPGTESIVIIAALIHEDGIQLPYPYKFLCTSIDEAPEILEDVPTYGFYV